MLPAADISFGIGGNAGACQVSGWSYPEDGYTWALGPESRLRVALQPGAGDLLLDMTLRPYMIPPYRSGQRVGVQVNGVPVGEARVQDDSALGFRVAAEIVAGHAAIDLAILCPDALCPSEAGGGDTRKLGVMVRDIVLIWAPSEAAAAPRHLPPLPLGADPTSFKVAETVRGFTGLAPDDLMLQFESLGANCEFGLAQRAFGAEPLGLLRFVGIDVQNLLRGLDFGFDGIDDPSRIRVYTDDGGANAQYVSVHEHYGIHRHSYQAASAMDQAAFLAAELRRVAFERRRFLEVLESGQKLFVYQRLESMVPAHVRPILNMLRSHGDNALLFVTLNHAAAPGSVDLIGPHLYRGNIDRLAPIGNALDSNLAAWLSLCANAYRLWRETGHGLDTAA